jgi:hypothetical protein
MECVTGDTWFIQDEDEFYSHCEPAKSIKEHAKAEEKISDCLWFFKECYADWKAMTFTAIFCSYKTPDYANYILSIQANKDDAGRWEIKTMKKKTK